MTSPANASARSYDPVDWNHSNDETMTELPQLNVAEPTADYQLRLEFSNGEIRLFDVRPYLDKEIFK